ncbi:MAG: AbrB family transcriptional regulator [Bauldia sp.]
MPEPGRLPFILMTLAIAGAGAIAAALLHLPAAWLSGAMIAVTVASLCRLDTRLPPRLFDAVLVLLGIVLGAGVTPELVGRVGAWPISLAGLLVSVVVVQLAVETFLVRIGGWDRPTAFFASLPGALSYVLAVAAATKADMPKVIVGQSIRLFFLVAALPSIIVAVGHAPPASAQWNVASLPALIVLVAASVAGGLLFRRLKFPGALLAGSFFIGAALHGSGLIEGTLPYPVVVAGFILLGAFVGGRFWGTDIWLLRQIGAVSVGALAVGLGVAACFAAAIAWLTGIGFAQVLMAFAPGGMDSMTSVAIALHMDSAYVAFHQLARFVLIALAAPITARLWFKR